MIFGTGCIRKEIEAVHVEDGKVVGILSIGTLDRQDKKKFFEIGLSEKVENSDEIYIGIFNRKRSEIMELIQQNPNANVIWYSFVKGPQVLTCTDPACFEKILEKKIIDGKPQMVPIVM